MEKKKKKKTPTRCGARSGVAERLQDLDSLRRTPMEFAERLLAFDSLRGARARVTERLLAGVFERLLDSYNPFQISKTPTVTAELERELPNMY